MTILVLTRPQADSERFLAAVEAEFGPVKSVISPVIEVVSLPVDLPSYDEVILTSANGVAEAKRLGVKAGTRAWCVGQRTAKLALEAGLEPISADGDADDLVELILSQTTATLCHIRGVYSRGQVAARLIAQGRVCKEAIAYDQRDIPPTEAALQALAGTDPIVLPLFSPRSALLIPAVQQAPVHVIAMSSAVAAEVADLGADTVTIAENPNFDAMLAATCRRLDSLLRRGRA
ncbi:uroporphyrinogen-III synthase [Marivivens donghaensis]|jgi:uroporphyrinogen-III synthase|uniref:uroporphyrinogen-III synthase n=1 Tax=Marivivens donghaensis TaxID=1699413 RepID=UPI003F6975BA